MEIKGDEKTSMEQSSLTLAEAKSYAQNIETQGVSKDV